MDLFQTIGSGVERVVSSVSDMGKRMKYQAKTATGNSKLRLKIMETENILKGLYEELGRSTYEERQDLPLSRRPAMEIMSEIQERREVLKGLENQLRYRQFKEPPKEEPLRCAYCNEPLDPEDRFCPSCGLKVTPPEEEEDPGEGIFIDDVEIHTKMCPNCGEQISIHAKYCSRCGTRTE